MVHSIRLKFRIIYLFAALSVFAGIVSAQAIEKPGITTIRNIEYVKSGHERQKLDIYLPQSIGQGQRLPLVVWIHGGGWSAGSKDRCPAVYLVKKGYVVASINYRLSQHAPFPSQIHDCKGAIRWLRANSHKYNIDANRIAVWGASAGGHLVALLGTTGNKELEGSVGGNLDHPSRVQAVCNFFGPTDMFAYYKDKDNRNYEYTTKVINQLLGGTAQEKSELARLANPVTHVSLDDSPFLIMHGDNDDLVPMKQNELLNEALKKAGVETKLHIVKGAGHGFGGPEIEKVVAHFFESHLKQEKSRSRQRYFLDVEYVPNGHAKQKLDIYLPPQKPGQPLLPIIVWIHGGAWRGGDKKNCRSKMFLEHGYAAASINYRLSQHAIWPAQIQDCKAAIRYLRANAKKYNIDPNRIGVWGSSAGGHLVAALGTMSNVKGFDVGPNLTISSSVQAVCDFFGPTDFTKMNDFPGKMDHDAQDSPESQLVGGPIQNNKGACKKANPMTYISKDDPPILICHGDADPLVPHNQSVIFDAALQKAGVNVTFHTVKGAGHGFRKPEIDRMVMVFFDKHLNN